MKRLLMTLIIALTLTANAVSGDFKTAVYYDTKEYATATMWYEGGLYRGFYFSGWTDFTASKANNDFSRAYSEWTLSHAIPQEWTSIGNLGTYAEYDNCLEAGEGDNTWRFGLSYHLGGENVSVLLKYAPVQLGADGMQLSALYNLKLFNHFTLGGFADLDINNNVAYWMIEPQLSVVIDDGIHAVAEYRYNDRLENSWGVGLKFDL
jgi:hypothetical protein